MPERQDRSVAITALAGMKPQTIGELPIGEIHRKSKKSPAKRDRR
jgi:hypothetical protein